MWAWSGFEHALRMAWEVWWALVLGFALSGVVQAWVPRAGLQRALGGRGPREIALATGLGAASSSCSYAAIAIAKSLFDKGASLVSAMAFQFASTNLVFELGIVLFLIVLMWGVLNLLVSRREEDDVRLHAQAAETGHEHPTAASDLPLRRKLVSLQAWSDVASNFRGDWTMLWKEIIGGFLIAGYVSLLPKGFFNALFITHAWAPLRIAENVLVGPLVAALAFVCSIGNVPLAAVLWAGGISFGGVIAFLFADLIIVPIVLAYRKYYGARFAAVLTAVMFGAMAVAGVAVDGVFSLAGLVPTHRPTIASIAERPVTWNYTSVLDVVFGGVFIVLIALTVRRGAKDPVCGMHVDRHAGGPTSVFDGRTFFFCGPACKSTFDDNPEEYA